MVAGAACPHGPNTPTCKVSCAVSGSAQIWSPTEHMASQSHVMLAAGEAVAGAPHLGKVRQAADEQSNHLKREGIECQVPAGSEGFSLVQHRESAVGL